LHRRTRDPAQVRLQHSAGVGEVLAQPAEDGQRRVGGGVVLHVEGHRRAHLGGRGADRPGVRLGQVLVERLSQRRELEADLGAMGERAGAQSLQQRQVFVTGGVGLVGCERVLAEVVKGHGQTLFDQFRGGPQGVGGRGAGDEALDHVAADGCRADELFYLGGSRRCEDHRTEHVKSVTLVQV
jgi:hypothetical protein